MWIPYVFKLWSRTLFVLMVCWLVVMPRSCWCINLSVFVILVKDILKESIFWSNSSGNIRLKLMDLNVYLSSWVKLVNNMSSSGFKNFNFNVFYHIILFPLLHHRRWLSSGSSAFATGHVVPPATVSLGSKSDLLQRPSFSRHLINIILSDFIAAQCRRLLLSRLYLFLHVGLPGRRRRARCSQLVCGGKSSGLLGLCWATIQPDGPVPGSAGSHSRSRAAWTLMSCWVAGGWITQVLNLLQTAGSFSSLHHWPWGELTDTCFALMKTFLVVFSLGKILENCKVICLCFYSIYLVIYSPELCSWICSEVGWHLLKWQKTRYLISEIFISSIWTKWLRIKRYSEDPLVKGCQTLPFRRNVLKSPMLRWIFLNETSSTPRDMTPDPAAFFCTFAMKYQYIQCISLPAVLLSVSLGAAKSPDVVHCHHHEWT